MDILNLPMLSFQFIQFFRYLNFQVLKQVAWEIGERRLMGLAAEMAYNNLFAIFPTLIGVLAAIGSLKISGETVNAVILQLLTLVPPEVIDLVKEFLRQTQLPQSRTVVILSILVAVWAASGAVSTAMSALDQIYQIPIQRRYPFWQAKLIAILLTIAMVALVLVASYLIFISDWLLKLGLDITQIPGSQILQTWQILRLGVAFGVLTIAFILLYRYGSSYWQVGTFLFPGALLAALLWAAMSQFLRIYVLYIGRFNLTYGTLSAGIILMLWLNWSSLVVLIGAQLNLSVSQAMQQRRQEKYLER